MRRPGCTIPDVEVKAALVVARKASRCPEVSHRTAYRLLATMRRNARPDIYNMNSQQKWRKRIKNARMLPSRCTKADLQLHESSTSEEICCRLHDVGEYRKLGSRLRVLLVNCLWNFDDACAFKLLKTLAKRTGIFCVNLGELPGLTGRGWHALHCGLTSTNNGVVFGFVDKIHYVPAPLLMSELGKKRRSLEAGWKTSTNPPLWRRKSTLFDLCIDSPKNTTVPAQWGMATWHPKVLC